MNLAEKIEKIKKEPEHIRLRYIWFFVFVSMIFIIMIWIFSLQTGSSDKQDKKSEIMDLDSFGTELDQQKKALQQTTNSIQDTSKKIQAEMSHEGVPEEVELKKTEIAPRENTKPATFPGM